MTQQNSSTKDLSQIVQTKLKKAKTSYAVPSEQILEDLFEVLFYTSLKTEEGQFIKVTITFIDPQNPDPSPPRSADANRWKIVKFSERIEFTVKSLVKLSKAADIWSASLAVYYDDQDKLWIWGMIDQAIHYHSFLNYEAEIEPEQPGLFQATINGVANIIVLFDYELFANLKQNTLISNYIDIFRIGELKDILQNCNTILRNRITEYVKKEFPEEIKYWPAHSDNIFKQTIRRILLRIQTYQHGGALLLTNNVNADLDIKYKIEYDRLFNSIENLLKLSIQIDKYDSIVDDYVSKGQDEITMSDYLDDTIAKISEKETRDELKGAIRFISSLSCVDGLIVLNNNLKVEGFGAVIKINKLPQFIYSSKTSRINEKNLTEVNPNIFGTRHRSMFSYCWANIGAVGFVISQDGDIRAITKIKNKLIMWENIRVLQFLPSKKIRRPTPLNK